MLYDDPKTLPTFLFMVCLALNTLALYSVVENDSYPLAISSIAAVFGIIATMLTARERIVRGIVASLLVIAGVVGSIIALLLNADTPWVFFFSGALVPGLSFLGAGCACVLAAGMKAKNFVAAFIGAVAAVLVPAMLPIIIDAIVTALIFAGFVYIVKNFDLQPPKSSSGLGGSSMRSDFS